MTKVRKSMAIQDEIKRLKQLGHSKSKVSKLLGINRETVRKYWEGPVDQLILDIPDWVKNLDWEYINKEINSKTPKTILFEELSENFELPSYQSFCQYIRNHPADDTKNKIVVRIERTPGDSVEVDYSGDSVQIINPATGEIYRVELFVGTLSYSGYFYAEFTYTQKLEDFIYSHTNMFRFFGGVYVLYMAVTLGFSGILIDFFFVNPGSGQANEGGISNGKDFAARQSQIQRMMRR